MLVDKNYIVNMLQRVLTPAVSKRHCSSVLKTPNVDLGTKRRHVAKAIKKLNKENKLLFGSLLETLPEKRKRQKEVGKTSLSNVEMLTESQTDRNEEVWWLSRMSSSKLVSSVRKSNTDCFTYSGRINQCSATKTNETGDITQNLYSEHASPKNCKILNAVPESEVVTESVVEKAHVFKERKDGRNNLKANKIGDITENLYSEHASPKNCKLSNTVPESEVVTQSVVEKVAVFKERKDRCNNFILPEVIIRNIHTFPLLNELKTKRTIAGNVRNDPTTDTDDKRETMYPSVTKVLNATMSESSLAALKRWRLKMIAELGEEGFQTHYRALLDAGALFHNTIQSYLAGTPQKVDPQIEGCWESLEAVLPNISNVKLLESHIVHSNLLYRGVIDCVAEYKKSTMLIEWKKSDKQKPELDKTYDAPVQVSAYMGAVNYDLKHEFQVEGGLVVVAYTDGSPAHIFPMSMSECQKYWSFWLKRLQQYWLRQSSSDS